MKELIEFLASRASEYLPIFFRIVAHPQANILTLARRPGALSAALAFFAITSAIGLGLQAPFLAERNEFVTAAGVLALYKVVEMAATALALVLVFRIFGGTGRFEEVLAATFYIICPPYLAAVLMNLVTAGVLAGFDPALAEEWRRTGEVSDGTSDAMWRIDPAAAGSVAVVWLTFLVAVFAWLIACWPVYARLNSFSRWRSVGSFLVGIAAVWGVGEVGLLIVRGLFPNGIGGAF